MGSFRGHVVPGIAVIFLGIWHTINTIRSYHFKGPSKFVSRFWYPFNTSLLILKNLELILILAFSLSAIIILVLEFPFLNHDFKLITFEHGTIFLHSAIYAGFALFSELPSLEGIMATSALAQELFPLRFHSSDHVGLEGHYHGLLQIIVVISLLAAIATTVVPTSFPVALVLSISYLFQGCWFVNMGFMLWIPKFVPQGCSMQLHRASGSGMVHGAVSCGSPEAESRAIALANLQFSWILAGILMFTGFCNVILFRKGARRAGQVEAYEQLQSMTPDSPLATDCFKLPVDL